MSFKIKKEEPYKRLLKREQLRFIRDEGLSPHFLDPAGHLVYYVLHAVERYFGREAREELEEVLLPRQRVRILSELQKLPTSMKLEFVVARNRKGERRGQSGEGVTLKNGAELLHELVQMYEEELEEEVEEDGDAEAGEIPF